MDKAALQQLIKGDAQLSRQLSSPKIQQFVHELLQDEMTFEALRVRFSSSANRRQHHHKNKAHTPAGFQNPNESPLSPLEVKLIEGGDSEEQQFLRRLLDLIQK